MTFCYVFTILGAAHIIRPLCLRVLQHWFRLHPEKWKPCSASCWFFFLVSRATSPVSAWSLLSGNPGSQLADATIPLYCDNHRLSCPPPWGPSLPKAPSKKQPLERWSLSKHQTRRSGRLCVCKWVINFGTFGKDHLILHISCISRPERLKGGKDPSVYHVREVVQKRPFY